MPSGCFHTKGDVAEIEARRKRGLTETRSRKDQSEECYRVMIQPGSCLDRTFNRHRHGGGGVRVSTLTHTTCCRGDNQPASLLLILSDGQQLPGAWCQMHAEAASSC